jgi:hypothetical protein
MKEIEQLLNSNPTFEPSKLEFPNSELPKSEDSKPEPPKSHSVSVILRSLIVLPAKPPKTINNRETSSKDNQQSNKAENRGKSLSEITRVMMFGILTPKSDISEKNLRKFRSSKSK